MDHDQRFKTLIQLLFEEFLLLFFKSWAELDAAGVGQGHGTIVGDGAVELLLALERPGAQGLVSK